MLIRNVAFAAASLLAAVTPAKSRAQQPDARLYSIGASKVKAGKKKSPAQR